MHVIYKYEYYMQTAETNRKGDNKKTEEYTTNAGEPIMLEDYNNDLSSQSNMYFFKWRKEMLELKDYQDTSKTQH